MCGGVTEGGSGLRVVCRFPPALRVLHRSKHDSFNMHVGGVLGYGSGVPYLEAVMASPLGIEHHNNVCLGLGSRGIEGLISQCCGGYPQWLSWGWGQEAGQALGLSPKGCRMWGWPQVSMQISLTLRVLHSSKCYRFLLGRKWSLGVWLRGPKSRGLGVRPLGTEARK